MNVSTQDTITRILVIFVFVTVIWKFLNDYAWILIPGCLILGGFAIYGKILDAQDERLNDYDLSDEDADSLEDEDFYDDLDEDIDLDYEEEDS